jgi:hypothetical protein
MTPDFNTMGTPAHSAAAVRGVCRGRSVIGWSSEICISENSLAYKIPTLSSHKKTAKTRHKEIMLSAPTWTIKEAM